MRLRNVQRGDRVSTRILFGIIRVLSGFRASDVIRTLKYRPAMFGGPHSAHNAGGPSTAPMTPSPAA